MRTKTLHTVRNYLRTRHEMSELDMLKVAKGLFYCFWMSDKPAIQQELAWTMARTLHVIPPKFAPLFIRCFFRTMVREWGGLDRFRMDKFFSLVRRTTGEMFAYLRNNNWDYALTREMMAAVSDEVSARATDSGRGVALHVASLWISALRHGIASRRSTYALPPRTFPTQNADGSEGAAAAAAVEVIPPPVMVLLLKPMIELGTVTTDPALARALQEGTWGHVRGLAGRTIRTMARLAGMDLAEEEEEELSAEAAKMVGAIPNKSETAAEEDQVDDGVVEEAEEEEDEEIDYGNDNMFANDDDEDTKKASKSKAAPAAKKVAKKAKKGKRGSKDDDDDDDENEFDDDDGDASAHGAGGANAINQGSLMLGPSMVEALSSLTTVMFDIASRGTLPNNATRGRFYRIHAALAPLLRQVCRLEQDMSHAYDSISK